MEDKIGPKLVKAEPTEEENRNKNPGAPKDEVIEIKKGAAIDVAGDVNSSNGYDNGAKELAPIELKEDNAGVTIEDNTWGRLIEDSEKSKCIDIELFKNCGNIKYADTTGNRINEIGNMAALGPHDTVSITYTFRKGIIETRLSNIKSEEKPDGV